jgi:hypothetical protein
MGGQNFKYTLILFTRLIIFFYDRIIKKRYWLSKGQYVLSIFTRYQGFKRPIAASLIKRSLSYKKKKKCKKWWISNVNSLYPFHDGLNVRLKLIIGYVHFNFNNSVTHCLKPIKKLLTVIIRLFMMYAVDGYHCKLINFSTNINNKHCKLV